MTSHLPWTKIVTLHFYSFGVNIKHKINKVIEGRGFPKSFNTITNAFVGHEFLICSLILRDSQ